VTLAARLPAFTWDRLGVLREKAGLHQNGITDLSMGTPVDPVPDVVRAALSAAADWPGYPATRGTAELRSAASGWLERECGVLVAPDDVLPVVGTKEFIAARPAHLGLGPGDLVVHPAVAYPTYDVGARLAGARALPLAPLGSIAQLTSLERVDYAIDQVRGLVWVNSPSNPTGEVLPVSQLREVVAWARSRGCVVASDECYITLGWDGEPPVSILHPSVCDGSFEGLLAVHSLSKRSNLAGYRAGFVTGDPALVASLLEIRKHAGLIMPGPVQAALTAALQDDAHAALQRARYAGRRAVLADAFTAAGWTIDHSGAGLYLWVTHPGYDCWSAAELLASSCGILVAPGELYGPGGNRHVRVALTGTDERVSLAAAAIKELAVALGAMDDEFQISYEGVALGVPVLTKDGEEFGILEHVLAVEEEDIFEGIVVWVGGGGWVARKMQRELSMGHKTATQFLETFRHNDLRFVPADKVAMITVGYIRCDLDRSEAAGLRPPAGAPVFYANAIDQAGPGQEQRQVYTDQYGRQVYRTMFGPPQWRQE
jgi:succinyldiaminopimelate transaminase